MLCVCMTAENIQCIYCHIDARHAEERGSSQFPLQRQLFITALVCLTVMQSKEFLCIWVYYSHISRIQVKPHSWVLTQCCTVKSTFGMCLVWSPWSICVVFSFVDSHYIGLQMWCTGRGLKIRGVCSSHSHRHKRTNNTNIVKLAFS